MFPCEYIDRLRGQLRNAQYLMSLFFLTTLLMGGVIGWLILFPGAAGL